MEYIKNEDILNYVNEQLYSSRIVDSYEEIKLFCEVEEIFVRPHHIKTFLRNKAKEGGVNLEATTEDSVVDLCKVDENLIQRSADRFMQEIKNSKYQFRELDWQYFNDLFRIYTSKCLKICTILEMLAGVSMLDKELLEELDITTTENGVLLSDVDRLLIPLKHNYSLALDTKFRAENLETYLTPVLSPEMNKDGVRYSECLPSEDLQDYFGTYSDKKQFIALTNNQQEEILEQTIQKFSNYINDDIDN